MIEDAVSIRYSRRILRKASLSPVKVFMKKKNRRSSVIYKKRTLGANSSLLKAKLLTKFGKKSKLEDNPTQTSDLNSALYKVTEKAKIVQKSKLDKYPKLISEKSSHNLKPAHKTSRKNIPELFNQKPKTRSSLNASQSNLIDYVKQQNLEIELSNERKKSFVKKNSSESASDKHSACCSLTVSESSLMAEGKATSKRLPKRKLKFSKVKKLSEKECYLQVTDKSPKTVSTQNTGKISRTSRHSNGKKSVLLSTESLNQEIPLHARKSESLVTHQPDKVTRQTKHAENKKSVTTSKGFDQSRIENSGISRNTSGFQSICEKPNPEKHSEKRKSSRISELNRIKILNKELSLSTSTSVLKNNQDLTSKKSSQSNKSFERHVRKRCKPTVSKKEIPNKVTCQTKPTESRKSITSKGPNRSRILSSGISLNSSAFQLILETPHPEKDSERRKSARLSKGLKQSRIPSSGISLNLSRSQSILETPHPEIYSKKRKSLRVLVSNPSTTLNKERSLSTSSSVLEKNQDSMLNKSIQLSSTAETPVAENHIKRRGRHRVSNEEISTGSFEKLKPSRGRAVIKQKSSSENFKLPLSKVTNNLPLDVLSTPAFTTVRVKSASDKCLSKPVSKSSKRKFNHSATENHFASEELHDTNKRKKSSDFPNCRVKGTLKHKRWLLNHLMEKNVGYEDDIFENQNLDQYKNLHFGEESDGSSVNIATPKFDCILTPALPKKTPRFKDCISPTELLQARKTAEEYLYRRNKKRKSGDMPSSADKNRSINSKNTTQDVPEKKKLDFGETVSKLIEVKKNLEKDAGIGDEDEDSYFSDASN